MTNEPHDVDELGSNMRVFINAVARAANPDRVYLTVKDESPRYTAGYVFCDFDATTVRCEVAQNFDTSVGVVLVAIPPRPDSVTGNFFCVGAYGGTNYVPGIVGTSVAIVDINGTQLATAVIGRNADDVSNPPTDAELDTAFGLPATKGDNFIGLLDDNVADANLWMCVPNGTSWWYAAMTKAT